MQINKIILLLLLTILQTYTTQAITNTPYAQVITKSKEDGFQHMIAKILGRIITPPMNSLNF